MRDREEEDKENINRDAYMEDENDWEDYEEEVNTEALIKEIEETKS